VLRLQRLIDALSDALDLGVAIDDHQFRLVVHSAHGQQADTVRIATLLRRRSPPEVVEWLRELNIAEVDGALRVPAHPGFAMRPRICIPIRHDGVLLAYMWLFEEERNITDADVESAVRAASDAATILHYDRVFEDASRQRERAVLSRLFGEGSEIPMRAAREALETGAIFAGCAYGVIAIRPADRVMAEDDPQALRGLAALDGIRRVLAPRSALVGLHRGCGALLMAIARGSQPDQALRAIAMRLHESLAGGEPDAPDWHVGVGPAEVRLDRALDSFHAARDALLVRARAPGIRSPTFWTELGAWRILCLALSDERADVRLHPGVDKLLRQRGGADLLETLRTYLEHGGDSQATSAALHVHRTSLYARLRRIESITGANLRSGDDRLFLQMSIRLSDLMAASN
jgi:hypothetical protein